MEKIVYYQKMLDALKEGSIHSIVVAAYDIIRMPIVVCDSEYIVIEKYPEDIVTGDAQWDSNKRGEAVRADSVFSVYRDEHWRIFNEKKSAMLIDWGYFEKIPRYGNILIRKGKFLGSLAVRIGNAKKEDWHIDFLNLFSDLLINAMYNDYRANKHSETLKEVFIQAIMSGEARTDEQLARLQENSGIIIKPSYRFSIISYRAQAENDIATLTYLSEILSSLNGQELHLIKDSRIYVLHYGITKGKPKMSESERSDLIGKYGLVEGFSTVFDKLSDIEDYIWQAEKVLLFANDDLKKTVFSYSEYASDVMVCVLVNEIPLNNVIHPVIKQLHEYDKANGTQYVNTLKVYIESFYNKNKAAEKLFIHRNTLLYRLNKIHDITKVDINDPQTGFHLLLNFRYFDKKQLN